MHERIDLTTASTTAKVQQHSPHLKQNDSEQATVQRRTPRLQARPNETSLVEAGTTATTKSILDAKC